MTNITKKMISDLSAARDLASIYSVLLASSEDDRGLELIMRLDCLIDKMEEVRLEMIKDKT